GAALIDEPVDGEQVAGLRPLRRPLRLFEGGQEVQPDQQLLQATAPSLPLHSFEGQLLRADGKRLDVVITASPLLDEDGKARGAVAAIVDVSEHKNNEAGQQALLYELQHRVKNIIATISALATRMLRKEVTAAQFTDAFLGRLRGM